MTIFLDFETRSRVDLSKVGSARYCEDPSTEPYCLAYAFEKNDLPELWLEGQPPPKRLMKAIEAGEDISGFNALSFERRIFEKIMGPRHGWAVPKLEQWRDTMHDALALAMPGQLEKCAAAIPGAPKKDVGAGRRAMLRLCKPEKKTGEFLLDRGGKHKELYLIVYKYCQQDVIAERSISQWLPKHVSGFERDLQLFTAVVNDRGIPVDLPFVKAVVAVLDDYVRKLNEEFFELTSIDKATKREQVRKWCNDRLPREQYLDNMQGVVLDALLADPKVLPVQVYRVLTIYRAMSHTSVAKFNTLLNMVCKDGTIKDNLIYHKANTGRYAGAGFQPQNLPQAQAYDPEWMILLFLNHDIDSIKLYGDPLEIASSLIRSAIKTPEGMKLVDGDLKQVEARGTSWVAGEENMLQSFRDGLDVYKTSASLMYKTNYENVTDIQRKSGKIAVLSGGFGGGFNALLSMAAKQRMEMPEEQAKKIISDFRAGRPKLVRCWYSFGDAAMNAVRDPGRAYPVEENKKFVFGVKGDFLFMSLPNGRLLSFPFPKVENKETPWGQMKDVVTAMWIDSGPKGNHKWTRRKIIGSNFFQSAVQGLCRDALMEAHLRIEKAGWPVILSVHDESISLVPDTMQYPCRAYERMMSHAPSWAPDLPVGTDVWEGMRFKK